MNNFLCLLILAISAAGVLGQVPQTSGNDFGELPYQSPSEIQQEEAAKRVFVNEYLSNRHLNQRKTSNTGCPTYVIPVVFHVYGTENPPGTVVQNGSDVNVAVIQSALDETNKDFRGLNADFVSVHDSFKSRRDSLDIEFRLAQLDPNEIGRAHV